MRNDNTARSITHSALSHCLSLNVDTRRERGKALIPIDSADVYALLEPVGAPQQPRPPSSQRLVLLVLLDTLGLGSTAELL